MWCVVGVVEEKGAGAAIEGSGDFFEGDVDSGGFVFGEEAEHFAEAGSCEIAVELLVDRHAAEVDHVGFLRNDLYIECSDGVVVRHFRGWLLGNKGQQ